MTRLVEMLGVALLLLGTACERSDTVAGPSLDAALRQDMSGWGVMPIGPMPAQDPALFDLGRALMFDPILSGNRDIACATCHHPGTHEGDGLSLAIGTGGSGLGTGRPLGPGRQFVIRNAPSLLNDGLGLFYLFWDGRLSNGLAGPTQPLARVSVVPGVSDLLAAQGMLPVVNRRERRGEPGDRDVFVAPNELAQFGDSDSTAIRLAIVRRLLAIPEYVAKFTAAFPGTTAGELRFEHAATALAAFQMQALTKTDSPFDRYLNHHDAALTHQQKRA